MNLQRIGGTLGVLVLLLGVSSTAQAQWGFGGGFGYGGGLGFGGGFANGAYTLEPPPYFSLFPPVYYSHITPRPYGFSPFAYPGFAQTPEAHGHAINPLRPSAATNGWQRRIGTDRVQAGDHQESVRIP